MRKEYLKKGFTLIELLITITIILILTVAGFVTFQKITEKQKQKEFERLTKEFESAAEVWMTKKGQEDLNKSLYNESSYQTRATLGDLFDANLIDGDIINPLTNRKFKYYDTKDAEGKNKYDADYVRIFYDYISKTDKGIITEYRGDLSPKLSAEDEVYLRTNKAPHAITNSSGNIVSSEAEQWQCFYLSHLQRQVTIYNNQDKQDQIFAAGTITGEGAINVDNYCDNAKVQRLKALNSTENPKITCEPASPATEGVTSTKQLNNREEKKTFRVECTENNVIFQGNAYNLSATYIVKWDSAIDGEYAYSSTDPTKPSMLVTRNDGSASEKKKINDSENEFTIDISRTYVFDLSGASGAQNADPVLGNTEGISNKFGGKGSNLKFNIDLKKGDKVRIRVGSQATGGNSEYINPYVGGKDGGYIVSGSASKVKQATRRNAGGDSTQIWIKGSSTNGQWWLAAAAGGGGGGQNGGQAQNEPEIKNENELYNNGSIPATLGAGAGGDAHGYEKLEITKTIYDYNNSDSNDAKNRKYNGSIAEPYNLPKTSGTAGTAGKLASGGGAGNGYYKCETGGESEDREVCKGGYKNGTCKVYNTSCSKCPCKTYKQCRHKDCGCEKYKTCKACGCDQYNKCRAKACNCATCATCTSRSCGTYTKPKRVQTGTRYSTCYRDVTKTKCRTYSVGFGQSCSPHGTCMRRSCACSSCVKKYKTEKYKCNPKPIYTTKYVVYNKTCRSCSACGCKTREKCRAKACGCNKYKACSKCKCNTYKNCRTKKCGCETCGSCKAAGCKEYNKVYDACLTKEKQKVFKSCTKDYDEQMNPGKGGKSILNSKLVKRDEEGNLEYTIGQAAAGNGIVKITSIREPFEDDNL